eukprot:PDM75752.1 hypothetical protein PRIPAC_40131 [Pristionchus pacificus]
MIWFCAFPSYLLLIILHTVMSINFKPCVELNSFCVVPDPCTPLEDDSSWVRVTSTTPPCEKAVIITLLSTSWLEIQLYGAEILDNFVSCNGLISQGPDVFAQRPTAHPPTSPLNALKCSIHLKSKNDIQLSKLLGSSRQLLVDGKSTGISYKDVDNYLVSIVGNEGDGHENEDQSLCNVIQLECEGCDIEKNCPSLTVKCAANKVLRVDDDEKTTSNLTLSPMILDHPLWITAEGRPVTMKKGACINKGTCDFSGLQMECESNKCSSSCKPENVTTIWPKHSNGSNQTDGIQVDGLICSNTTSMYHARRIDGRNRMIVVRKGTKVSCRERVTQSSTRSPLPTLHEKVASVLLPLALLLALLMLPVLIHTRVRCIVTRYRHGQVCNRHAHITKELATNTFEVISENQVDNTIQSRYTEPPKMTFGEFVRQLFSGFGKRDASSHKSESARKKTDDDEEKEKLLTARPPIIKCEVPTQPPKKETSMEQSSSGPSVEQAPREPEIKQGDGQPLSSKQLTNPSVSEKKKGSGPSSHTSNLTSSNSGGIPPSSQ